MSGNNKGPKGFGHGSFGGNGILPWGGFVPDIPINESLKIKGYKAVLGSDVPSSPKGFKAVTPSIEVFENQEVLVLGYKAIIDSSLPMSPVGYKAIAPSIEDLANPDVMVMAFKAILDSNLPVSPVGYKAVREG